MKKIIIITSLSLLLLSGCSTEIQNESDQVDISSVQEVVKNNMNIQIQIKASEIVKKENYMRLPLYIVNQSDKSSMNVQGIQLEISGFSDEIVRVTMDKSDITKGWLSSGNFTKEQGIFNLAMVEEKALVQNGHIGDIVLIIDKEEASGMTLNITGEITDINEENNLIPYQLTI